MFLGNRQLNEMYCRSILSLLFNLPTLVTQLRCLVHAHEETTLESGQLKIHLNLVQGLLIVDCSLIVSNVIPMYQNNKKTSSGPELIGSSN